MVRRNASHLAISQEDFGKMVFYHVRVTARGARHDEVKNDIDEETLESQFLANYRTGRPITVNGRVIQPDQIDRVRINASDVPAQQIINLLKLEDQNSRVAVLGGPSYEWRAANWATDVTDQFITGPPGTEIPSALQPSGSGSLATSGSLSGPGDKRSVFIVSGRDTEATAGLVHVLRAMNLRIVEWSHAVIKTGIPNPYIGDVVATGLRMADAAIVVITPDDLVKLRPDLLHEGDGEVERTIYGQARPNVIYEAGYADALGLNRTLIVEIGQSKPFSDIAGRNTLRYDGSPARRNALAQRLRLAGLEPDINGDEWLTVGDVTGAINTASTSLEAAKATVPEHTTDR
jgi:predicted nucleotide-binding protein